MKFTKYFMPFAALALLASCSNDNIDGPNPNGGVNNEGGDPLYVNLNITQSLSTRTTSPTDGVEIGTENETTIGSALLIFTGATDHLIKAVAVTSTTNFELVGSNGQYAASFTMLKDELKKDLGSDQNKSYRLYVIANPTQTIVGKYLSGNATLGAGTQIQKTLELNSDGNDYWTDGKFVMTSAADPAVITITDADLANGAHSTKATALQLGNVAVQRVMSRFDIAAENLTYSSDKGNLPLEDEAEANEGITVKINGAYLVNQATVANVFKVGGTSDGWTGWLTSPQAGEGDSWNYFEPEVINNYVISPTNTSFSNSLFANGAQIDLRNENITYDPISTSRPDDADYKIPSSDSQTQPNYYFYRYAMENTIQPATGGGDDDQRKGVTTGIVFRALLEGGVFANSNGAAIYAYGNTIIGTIDKFDAYEYDESYEESTTATDINEIIAVRHNQAVNDFAERKYDSLDKALVANGFSIYRPEEVEGSNQYYCYYVYYNRHNDNGNNALMGPMEFATVRNNVYKLNIKTIKSLGHPGNPDDDPDPEDPDDPDETPDYWCELSVKVLPWEVRINDIEF